MKPGHSGFAALLVVLAVFAVAAVAGEFDRNALLSPNRLSLSSGGLLDPSRLTISQSYSMSFCSGLGPDSWNGLYLSTLQYRFAVPVTLSLDLGFAHQPGALFAVGPVNADAKNGAFVIPRMELTYRPFRNTLLRFQYFDGRNLGASSNTYFGYEDLLITPGERFNRD